MPDVCPECGGDIIITEDWDEGVCYYECTDCDYSEYAYDIDKNYVPEGCAACGGPYPQCKTSCKIFDD